MFESGRPIAHVAKDLGVSSEVLRKRVRQAEADNGTRPDLPTTAEREPAGAGLDRAWHTAGSLRRLGGVAVIAAFVVYYWLPISGELSFWRNR